MKLRSGIGSVAIAAAFTLLITIPVELFSRHVPLIERGKVQKKINQGKSTPFTKNNSKHQSTNPGMQLKFYCFCNNIKRMEFSRWIDHEGSCSHEWIHTVIEGVGCLSREWIKKKRWWGLIWPHLRCQLRCFMHHCGPSFPLLMQTLRVGNNGSGGWVHIHRTPTLSPWCMAFSPGLLRIFEGVYRGRQGWWNQQLGANFSRSVHKICVREKKYVWPTSL